MHRRKFIKSASMAATCGIVPAALFSINEKTMQEIGIQLFSLPKLLEKDFPAALSMLNQMGYRKLEFYGPFTFSNAATKVNWKALEEVLGFSGSGFFGHTPKEMLIMLQDQNIKAPALHTDLVTLQTSMGPLAEACHIIGTEYVGIAAIPLNLRPNLDGYKRVAETFNKVGEAARKEGLRFYYHNHGYGLQEMEGQIPLQVIFAESDPNLVFFEMDIYWTKAGGADPIQYLDQYKNRYQLMHLKDMKEEKRFSGDGGDPEQWMELFPFMTTAGDGVLDLQGIISKATEVGVKHFFVEQDMVANPDIALKVSHDYLKALTL